MAETSYDKFRKLLAELFMFDQADLDFGIYRIMNAKRDEITRFLDVDLLPQLKDALKTLDTGRRSEIETELGKAIEGANQLRVPPESSPQVQELRKKLADTTNIADVESELFSYLYNFFSRYYDGGDFISKRRYKPGVYAIPYEGEEVKLYWANADQYYVKSSEYFRDYAFRLPDGRRVHFKVVSAETELNNNKPSNGTDRRFLLAETDPIVVQNGELVIRFDFKPDHANKVSKDGEGGDDGDPKKSKVTQQTRNAEAAQRILADPLVAPWAAAFLGSSRTPDRTVLDRHLYEYTARNTFDYFIHKDLGGFLRRELDFFLKSEVVHLDDIETKSSTAADQYLARVRALRRIGGKIIDFLAQMENFEKKLWLKKKFVIETNYCVSLDKIPSSLYPEILANQRQIDEWIDILQIGNLPADIFGAQEGEKGFSAETLKRLPQLVVDTVHFDADFRHKLLAAFDDLDSSTTGLLVHADNAHALRLLASRFRSAVRCSYIDPPYNRGGDDFNYKDNYRHSSWLSMIRERLALAKHLLKSNGVIFTSIDENERTDLEHALVDVFGESNRVEELIWVQNTTHSQSPTYSTNHEYVEVFAKNKAVTIQEPNMYREPKPGFNELQDLVTKLNPDYPSLDSVMQEIRSVMMRHLAEYKEELASMGLTYNADTKKQDPWRGIYNYRYAEYRDESNSLVPEDEAKERRAKLVIWRESDPSMPAGKQSPTTRDPNDLNYRFYKPPHYKTGKPCSAPSRGWGMPYKWPDGSRDSFEHFASQDRIVWGKDEQKIPGFKRFLHEVETNVAKSVIHDYTNGEKQVADLFGRTNAFPNPKPSTLVQRFILQTSDSGDYVMDFFAGSGTTLQATWEASETLRFPLRFIVSDMGPHFDTIILPRLKKVMFSRRWSTGKPINPHGRSAIIKYIRLESYEDALNNLALRPRPQSQQKLLQEHDGVREDYMLRYMLDVETTGSQSLLNVDRFEDPFGYTMNISTGTVGETRPVNVDLVETFNYLLGLRVSHIDTIRGFKIVEGRDPDDEKVLVIWRNTQKQSNTDLDEFFQKQGYNTRDKEFDIVYVNGDNNLENLRREDETWKVRLIEEDFRRLMFDVKDV